MKILVVVDMQKDFIDGSLGTPEAVAIVKGGFKFSENNVFSLYAAGMVLYLVSRNIDFAIGCDVEGKKITIHKHSGKNDIFTPDDEDIEDVVSE